MTEPTVWPQSPYATIRWRMAKVSADGPGPDVIAGPANDQAPTGATVRSVEPRRAQEAS